MGRCCLNIFVDSLRPHGLQHARPPCLSPSPGICPSSCSFHQWCCPAISTSDTLSSCPWSSPAAVVFPIVRLFVSVDQNTGASASTSVFTANTQGWSPLRLIGLILMSKGLSGVFSSTTVQRHQFLAFYLLYGPALTTVHDHWSKGTNLRF